jgi:hypothetical protein
LSVPTLRQAFLEDRAVADVLGATITLISGFIADANRVAPEPLVRLVSQLNGSSLPEKQSLRIQLINAGIIFESDGHSTQIASICKNWWEQGRGAICTLSVIIAILIQAAGKDELVPLTVTYLTMQAVGEMAKVAG